jgi:hypothetical protein
MKFNAKYYKIVGAQSHGKFIWRDKKESEIEFNKRTNGFQPRIFIYRPRVNTIKTIGI